MLPIILSKSEILASILPIRISTSSNVFLVSLALLEEELFPPELPEPPEPPEPLLELLEEPDLELDVATLALVAPDVLPLE